MDQSSNNVSNKGLVVYVVSKDLIKFSSLLPSNIRRSMMVHSLHQSLGLLSQGHASLTRIMRVVEPGRATRKDLEIYHSSDYLDFILDPKNCNNTSESEEASAISEFGLEDDCPLFKGLPDYVYLVAGATLKATQALKYAEVALCWDGGRHHARKGSAAGFCYVADCVLSILHLKRAPSLTSNPSLKPKIMYLDLDLHFSDGVSGAFYTPGTSSSQILTFSIHHAAPGFFPVSPLAQLPSVSSPDFDPFTLSLPLQQGASDKTFSAIWPIVEQTYEIFQPDYCVLQCGVDGLAGDPCATFNWSLGDGPGSLGWCVERVVKHWRGRKLLLGGGGYSSPGAARAWAYLTSIAMDNPLSLDTDIPDEFPAISQFGPSFTLDVSAGNMQDQNSPEYLHLVETRFMEAIAELKDRV
ncbi:hypothetical protein C8J56DRAFT_227578 [Mycena floridula]|nr:hypothetical protein C8J56DRAFT_227578 [Mycena floridula]